MSEFYDHLKAAPQIDHADRPLVLFKVGVLGSMPLDFPEELAKAYDMPMISSDEIRKDLIDQNDEAGMPKQRAQNIKLQRIQRIVRTEARESLRDNEDLMIDMFANSPRSRESIQNIAEDTGAIAIGLWANTSYATVMNRVTEWTESDGFVVPIDRWERQPDVIAKGMMRHVEPPTRNEGMYSFYLDGEADTDGLLGQVESYFHRTGLMSRFVDSPE